MNKSLCFFFLMLLAGIFNVSAHERKPQRFLKPVTFVFVPKSYDTTGFYNFNLTDIDGNKISLGQFRGKKILFINTATNSSYTSQYASLEKLYQKYKDSLVIIAIPSNSFGNEGGDNATIKDFVKNTYGIHYILAQKTIVAGDNQSPLYGWLTHMEQNNMMSNTIQGDFYKFLVDGSGRLVGAFVSSVDPMSDDMQSVISN
jgi:glutathione peroxidase